MSKNLITYLQILLTIKDFNYHFVDRSSNMMNYANNKLTIFIFIFLLLSYLEQINHRHLIKNDVFHAHLMC